MLKTRVITAVIMAVVALSAIFAAPPLIFALASGILVLGVGSWEASRLARWHHPMGIGAYIVGIALISAGLWWGVSMPISGAWLALVALTWFIPLRWLSRPQTPLSSPMIAMFLGLVLSGTWLSLVLLQSVNPWLIVWVVLIIAAADVGAYFTGRTIGGAKLAVRISPGKTWSGALGGLCAATGMAVVAQHLLPVYGEPHWVVIGLMGLFLAAISIVGDLTISLLKRQAGLKDSSKLLPGHGGILDRLDSLGAALPFFTLAMAWFYHG